VSVSLFRRTIVVLLHAQEEAMSFFISRVLTRPVYVSALLPDRAYTCLFTNNDQRTARLQNVSSTCKKSTGVASMSDESVRKKMIVSSQNSVQYGRQLNRVSLNNANHNLHTKKYKSLFSFLHMLTTRHYLHSPAARSAAVRRAAIDRYFPLAGRTAANLQQWNFCCGTDRRMDRRTDARQMYRPYSA